MFQNPLPLSVTKNSSPARLNALDEVWYEITVASSYNTVQDNIFLLLMRVSIGKKKSIVLGSVNCGHKGPIKHQCIHSPG